MNQFFPAVFNQQQYIGNSHYGGEVAKTAAAGAAQRKVITPYSRFGVVGQGVENFDSPVGGMQGNVTVPTSIAPAEIIPITIDTTMESGRHCRRTTPPIHPRRRALRR